MFDLTSMPAAVARGTLLSIAALFWVIFLVRLIGARTLSKMTAFDFLVTLATGSLLATATAASTAPAFAQALAGLTTLLVAQCTLAWTRQRADWFKRVIENEPRVLLRDGAFIDSALRRSRVSRADVLAKLREADVAQHDAGAVILETTGDISVLTGSLSSSPNRVYDI